MNISIEWWKAEDGSTPKEDHKNELIENALERVPAMILEGYSLGELLDNLCTSNADPNEGVDYRGYWTLSEEGK